MAFKHASCMTMEVSSDNASRHSDNLQETPLLLIAAMRLHIKHMQLQVPMLFQTLLGEDVDATKGLLKFLLQSLV